MTEQLRQSLSAVIDGEADAFELRRVLDELERDPDLREAWERYHLIGSVLRGERTLQSQSAARVLASRVPQAVRESSAAAAAPAADAVPDRDLDPAVPARPGAGWVHAARGRRGVVGLALAASVVLASVLAFNPFEVVPAPSAASRIAFNAAGSAQDPLAPAGQRVVAGVEPGGTAARFPQASQSDLRRAHAYMLQHAQQQGLEQRGVISLVKMATYEAP